jgi:hypothetical protein
MKEMLVYVQVSVRKKTDELEDDEFGTFGPSI